MFPAFSVTETAAGNIQIMMVTLLKWNITPTSAVICKKEWLPVVILEIIIIIFFFLVNCSLLFPIGLFRVCLSSYYTKYQDGSDTKVHQISVNLKRIVMSAYFGPLEMCMFLWTNQIIPCLTFMLYKTLFSNEILGWHSSYQAGQEIGIRSYFSCLLDLNLTELWITHI